MSDTIVDNQYVIFKLGKETFGVEINKIKEIIVYQEATQIPGTREIMKGVINLRGRVIPIFNLRYIFGFPEGNRTRDNRIVVVEANDNTVGIMVDAVSEVMMIPGSVIEKPLAMISSGFDSFVAGIAKMDNKLVIVLDLEKTINIGFAEVG